jgi:hypothetical protein
LLLAACGGSQAITQAVSQQVSPSESQSSSESASIAELPVYPDAVELAADSPVADTLAGNMEQNAAMSEALGGLGGTAEQIGYQLPSGTTWDQVKDFYAKELEGNGWSSGLGNVAGMAVDVNAIMDTANEGNDMFQTAIWSTNKQTLTVVYSVDPTNQEERMLILSLSSR